VCICVCLGVSSLSTSTHLKHFLQPLQCTSSPGVCVWCVFGCELPVYFNTPETPADSAAAMHQQPRCVCVCVCVWCVFGCELPVYFNTPETPADSAAAMHQQPRCVCVCVCVCGVCLGVSSLSTLTHLKHLLIQPLQCTSSPGVYVCVCVCV